MSGSRWDLCMCCPSTTHPLHACISHSSPKYGVSRSRYPLAEQFGRSTSVILLSLNSSWPVALARTSLRIIHAHIVPIILPIYIPGIIARVDNYNDSVCVCAGQVIASYNCLSWLPLSSICTLHFIYHFTPTQYDSASL